MVELNLIPWRQQKQEYDKKRQRLCVMLGVLIALCLWMALHAWLQSQIDYSREHLKILQLELTRMNAKQNKNTPAVHKGLTPHDLIKLLSVLAARQESGVCLHHVAFDSHDFILDGHAWSTISLLAYINKIAMPEGWGSFALTKIEKKSKYAPMSYSVKYKEAFHEED